MTTYFTHVISPDEHKRLAGDRERLRRGEYGADEIKALDLVSPGWSFSEFDHSWNESAIAAAGFYECGGRHSSTRSNDPDEAKLGTWLGIQRRALKNNTLRSDRRAWLDRHYPTWSETPDSTWNRKANAAADFYVREGRHPGLGSDDPDEAKLGTWLGVQRGAFKNNTLRSDRRAWLDEHYPTWNETFNTLWHQAACNAATFYSCEGRNPAQGSDDPDEAKLGNWLGKQRRALKNNTLRSDRRAWLDEHYPTWNETIDVVWLQNARSSVDLYEREGHHPKARSKNPGESELQRWLYTQRVRLKNNTLRPDRRAWLDEHYPTWTIARP